MAGLTTRPRRAAGTGGQVPGAPGMAKGDPLQRVQAMLTGPEPRWARPLLMLMVAASLSVALVAALLQLAPGVEPRAFEQHSGDAVTKGVEASLIAQSFRNPASNLSRIDLASSVVGAIPAEGKVRLVLGDGPEGDLVYEAPLNGLPSYKGYALSFSFPPIPDLGGVTYTVVLETPGSRLSRAIELTYNSFDALSSGSMYLDDVAQPGDLTLSAYYHYGFSSLLGMW